MATFTVPSSSPSLPTAAAAPHPAADRHTAAVCDSCAALSTGLIAMVARTGSCDRVKAKDLVAECGVTLGVFLRHMGDVQRCLVTTYRGLADVVATRLEAALRDAPDGRSGLRDGLVAGALALDDLDGAAFLYYVAVDRSRDPVIWLERDAAGARLATVLAAAPFPKALGGVAPELFTGAAQATLRRRVLAEGGFGDRGGLRADAQSLVDVFCP